jgi:uncharacterized protein YjbI with pentapeptide repeats
LRCHDGGKMQQPRLRAWRLARAAKRAERQTARPSAPDLPAIAAKADDLEEIKKAVEDAASVSGGLWLSYLLALSYVAVTVDTVTHQELLLVRPVRLPFFNVEAPLLAFFALAPFVVLIVHAYVLMHFFMLGKKASRFHTELRRQLPDGEINTLKSAAVPDGANKEIRDKLRWLLPSNIFVQLLAGPPELRIGIFGSMLKLIALATLVVFPILVLLLLQIQFLPFHEVNITWMQRAALILDIVFLWRLRPPIVADLSVESSGRAQVFARALRGVGFALAGVISVVALWFSIVVATIPGEWQETALAGLDRPRWRIAYMEDDKEKTKLVSTHDLLFAGDVNPTTRRRNSLFSNTLVLPGFNLYAALNIDDPKKLAWKEHLFDLRARHLEQAVLDGADLTKADFTGAFLQGASLDYTQLQGASFDRAELQGASLANAQLQGASLYRARLEEASLDWARLQGASLFQAQLQGASVKWAYLQGAYLFEAQLQGATLTGAQLQGATLDETYLQGTSFHRAYLQGASLSSTQLQGASLDEAYLQGASLALARLVGTSLDEAHLQVASLSSAQLQGALITRSWVNATDYSGAFLWRTNWGGTSLGSIKLENDEDSTWEPVWEPSMLDPISHAPWDAKAYEELRVLMISIPAGKMRDDALKRIKTLDCGNPDKKLASCNPAAQPPPEVLDWQEKLAQASSDKAAYKKALAKELRSLVCASDADAIHTLRGIIKNARLQETDDEAPALVDYIMNKDCPVSASLTGNDKTVLLEIKQRTKLGFPPPPAPKKEK